MVPKLVTRSRKMWLRIPTPQRPQSARYEGESHLRQRQIASVRAASNKAQIGRQSSECVILHGPKHERPCNDAAFVYGFGRKEVRSVECRFCDERTGDAVSDGVHE